MSELGGVALGAGYFGGQVALPAAYVPTSDAPAGPSGYASTASAAGYFGGLTVTAAPPAAMTARG